METKGFRKLRENTTTLQYLLDTIVCGIVTVDDQGRIAYTNDSARRMLGASREELVGAPVDSLKWKVLSPEGDPIPPQETPFARVLTRGENISGEIYTVEGEERLYFAVNAAPLHDADGTVTGAVADLVDITERTRVQHERDRLLATLQESEHRYRMLTESVPVGVFECDAEGCWIYVNPRWSAISGLSRAQSLEFGWTDAIHPQDRAEVLRGWRASAEEPGAWSFEYRLLRPEGEQVWVRTLKSPVVFQGKNGCRFVGTVENITSQKEAEQELVRAKTAAEEANLAKSRFLASVSHEIRTPMTVFMGMVELTLGEQLGSEARRYLETAFSSAESLLYLIEDILEFSELETDRLVLRKERFDLGSCLREVVEIFREEAAFKGIKLGMRIMPEVPPMLIGDAPRLRRILRNLVGNAVKFTEEGEVVLDVSLCGDCPKDSILFSVRDTGIGIPLERVNELMSPFTQADASNTRRYGGTGLGLAISKGLVEQMGGRIWIENPSSGGSVVSFSFPLE